MPLDLNIQNLQWHWKSFDQITKEELYEILSFRQSIFVVEQKSWYQDADGLDNISLHLLLKEESSLVGYLRLIPPGEKYETPSIGRVAIKETLRGNSIGSELVNRGVKKSSDIYLTDSVTISAQNYLTKFYQNHGFIIQGEVYDEDGIPHVKMIKDG